MPRAAQKAKTHRLAGRKAQRCCRVPLCQAQQQLPAPNPTLCAPPAHLVPTRILVNRRLTSLPDSLNHLLNRLWALTSMRAPPWEYLRPVQ